MTTSSAQTKSEVQRAPRREKGREKEARESVSEGVRNVQQKPNVIFTGINDPALQKVSSLHPRVLNRELRMLRYINMFTGVCFR